MQYSPELSTSGNAAPETKLRPVVVVSMKCFVVLKSSKSANGSDVGLLRRQRYGGLSLPGYVVPSGI